ncbi:MT-A70 family methyltransferase [Methylobacterium thuringiense]|uniref:Uncharacterized protein n=1 Tax=Methylobacterium thuringiense TaxID=1003091 RepID=A0ABQ4TGY3_9HYPH|nr:MT-A70 family methyltransferase [Methylobacterium thuringiense]GJE54556.1 hypothetical protein EKPJFOCH_1034 [Methylobacterium thuringiense]
MSSLSGYPQRHYRVVLIDPPTKFVAGTKSRPQHYPRMTWPEILALPVRDLLHPDGARVFIWMSAPHMCRVDEICRAYRLRYSSCFPWVKLWSSGEPLFFCRSSIARGTGLEVAGNAEYVIILKSGTPHSIKGRPFPGVMIEPRREHSRKPPNLHAEIEARIPGPRLEMFAREKRPGWDAFGNEVGKFDAPVEFRTLQAAE